MEPHAEDADLSPHEREVLAALDRDLSRHEPRLARQLRRLSPAGTRSRTSVPWFGPLLMILGLAVVVTTVMVSALVAFGGVLLMAAGAILTARSAEDAVARLTRQLSGDRETGAA